MTVHVLPGGPKTLFEVVERFFEEDDWPCEKLPDIPVLRVRFKGKHAVWRCYARTDEDRDFVFFYSSLDTFVPEEKRLEVAEFITRANYGLIIGNFELDFDDGELRYKTSLDMEGGTLTLGMVRQIVYANVQTMDRYYPGLMKLLFGDVGPKAALAVVEGDGE